MRLLSPLLLLWGVIVHGTTVHNMHLGSRRVMTNRKLVARDDSPRQEGRRLGTAKRVKGHQGGHREMLLSAEAPSPGSGIKKYFEWLPVSVRNGIASGAAAAVVKTILQPFDTIKTVQQAQRGGLGPLKAAQSIMESRGVIGFWSGIGVTIVGSSPSVAIYFGCYSAMRKYLSDKLDGEHRLLTVAASAAVGNTIASVFRVPYEVIKQRVQYGIHDSTRASIAWCIENEGLRGLFGGGKLSSQIVRDVPYAMVTLMSYELLQDYFESRVQRQAAEAEQAAGSGKQGTRRHGSRDQSQQTQTPRKHRDAMAGAIAGGLGTLATSPMDVIKTRTMTQAQAVGKPGTRAIAKRIFRDEGLNMLFVGTVPRLMHKIPANGLFFLCYEYFKQILV